MRVSIFISLFLYIILSTIGWCHNEKEAKENNSIIYSIECESSENYQKKYGKDEDGWDYFSYCKPKLKELRELVKNLPPYEGDYLQKNIENHDLRFIGVYNYSCHIPQDNTFKIDEKYLMKYGVKCFEGTSDTMDSSESVILTYGLIEYAKLYNNLLLKYLMTQGEK